MDRLLEESDITAEEISELMNFDVVESNEETEETEETLDITDNNEEIEETVNIEESEPEPEPELIPENSPTLLLDEQTSRFSSAIWFDKIQEKRVTVAGIGGIGSNLVLQLSRVKPASITIYDADKVEIGNLAGQMFDMKYIDEFKTNAIRRIVIDFSNYFTCNSLPRFFSRTDITSPIAMCGFDNMMARKVFFEAWRRDYTGDIEALFIDGRLSAESMQVFCIQGTDYYLMDKYAKEWLFEDSEAERTVCSYKQTSFCANMIASIMVNLFVNHIANLCNPVIPREIPFLTTYEADTMILKTRMS